MNSPIMSHFLSFPAMSRRIHITAPRSIMAQVGMYGNSGAELFEI